MVGQIPNPTNDFLNILLYDEIIESVSNYEILDINGRVIKTGLLNQELNQRINIDNINKGMYLINIIVIKFS